MRMRIKDRNRDEKEGQVSVEMETTPLKKVHEFPVSSRDVTNQTPPWQE